MKKENSIALILYQTLGYLWHLIVYIVLVPSLLVLMGQGLDYLLFKYLLSFDLAIKLDPTVATVLELSAFALIAFGVLIILEASLTLYKEAKAFPFSNITNKHLQPSKLATSGWYARVRHPMILGYVIVMSGLSILMFSPSMLFWLTPVLALFMVYVAKAREERRLLDWFGKEYKKYQENVPALIPKL